jgi:hypothetical protein
MDVSPPFDARMKDERGRMTPLRGKSKNPELSPAPGQKTNHQMKWRPTGRRLVLAGLPTGR